jgi:hypothetical protein
MPLRRNLPVVSGITYRGSRQCSQEVCPWNSGKVLQVSAELDYRPGRSREFEVRSPSARGASASPRSGRSCSRFGDAEGSSRTSQASGTPHGSHSLPGTESASLVELMRMTREEWDGWTRGSAIRRAGYAGLKRNVAAAMGNWLASVDEAPEEAVAVLREAREDEEPAVRGHAAWALSGLARP